MIKLEHISKAYGKKLVLDDVSLTIEPGRAIGILGANGSGKSTLLSCIVKQFAGNKELVMGYVPQENPLFDELNAVDNLRMWTSKKAFEIRAALDAPPLSALGISEYMGIPVSKMSGGMKKRLSIAAALINHPSLLLMDEPFAALDLVAKHDILDFMRYYLSQGGSLLVASHEEALFKLCSKVYLLKNGRLEDTTGKAFDKEIIELLRN